MDAYAECPCGSGKKIKFCCHEIMGEMQKVERLRENQPQLAINMLEKLRHTHPQNPWVVTSEAMLQIQAEDPTAARKSLAPFLKQHPAHPRANALYALACGQTDGFIATRKLANRAFKLCTPATAHTVCAIAIGLFQEHRDRGEMMAARQLLSFVVRLTPEGEQKKNIIDLLMMLDAAESIPWPLRGVHPIPGYDPPEAVKPHVAKAHQLSKICCFDESVALLQEAVDQAPEMAELWHDLALHQAWEGNQVLASASFRQAAERYSDVHLAAECEVMAQLLGPREPVLELSRAVYMGRVNAIDVALERLRSRDNVLESELEQEEDSGATSYRFTVLSHAPSDVENPPLDAWPVHLGSISMMTSSENAEQALIQWSDLEEVGRVQEFIEELLGDLIEEQFVPSLEQELPEEEVQEAEVVETASAPGAAETQDDEFGSGLDFSEPAPPAAEPPPEEVAEEPEPAEVTEERDSRWLKIPLPVSALDRVAHRRMPPREISAREYRAHVASTIQSFVRDVWAQSPLESLGGRTPAEAREDSESRARLEAAATVIEALGQAQGLPIERDTVRQFASDTATYEVGEEASLQAKTLFQLQRLNLQALTDEQLNHVIGRADIAQLPWLAGDALQERLRRQQDVKERMSTLYALSEVAQAREDLPRAIEWIRQAITEAQALPNSFEVLLGLKLRLVNLWIANDVSDPQCKNLLVELWHNYGNKVPHLRDQLAGAVEAAGIEPPWETAILVAAGDGTLSAAEAGSSGKKLILPGID